MHWISLLFLQVSMGPPQTLTRVNVSSTTYRNLLSLFKNVPETVYVFQEPEGHIWIEGWHKDSKEVLVLTPSEWAQLSQEAPSQVRISPSSHRTRYLIGQALLGLSIYSWSFPIFLHVEKPEVKVALASFTPFTWLVFHWLKSRNRLITAEEAWAGVTGGILGAFHGSMLFHSARGVFPISVTKNLVDGGLARQLRLTLGIVQRQVNAHLYGIYHAYLLSELLSLDLSEPSKARLGAAFSLAEGYLTTALFRNETRITTGDALFELRFSAIGAELGPLILRPIFRDRGSQKAILATSLMGQITTQYLSQRWSTHYDLSVSGAILSALVPYLLDGVTAGLGLLLDSDLYWRYYPLLIATTDIALTWKLYTDFRTPQGSLKTSQDRQFLPFIAVSPTQGHQKILGFLWMW